MRNFLLIPLILLVGCTTLDNAGTSSYRIKPMELSNGSLVCCDVQLNNGKEYASFEARMIKHGDDYEVYVHGVNVLAFKGQEIVATATTDAAKKAASVAGGVLMAPVVAPAAGAVLQGILK